MLERTTTGKIRANNHVAVAKDESESEKEEAPPKKSNKSKRQFHRNQKMVELSPEQMLQKRKALKDKEQLALEDKYRSSRKDARYRDDSRDSDKRGRNTAKLLLESLKASEARVLELERKMSRSARYDEMEPSELEVRRRSDRRGASSIMNAPSRASASRVGGTTSRSSRFISRYEEDMSPIDSHKFHDLYSDDSRDAGKKSKYGTFRTILFADDAVKSVISN